MTQVVSVGGRELKLSNLEKVLYPATGLTKAGVIDYYRRIAPVILPHLQSRPLTMKRYPDGVEGEFFFEKNCPAHRPDWVATGAIEGDDGESVDYCLVENLETLIWVANLASLELHTLLSRYEAVDTPTMAVFDLDPGEPAGLLCCAQVALTLRDVLNRVRLKAVPKVSGKKGLQVYVPFNTGPLGFDETKAFAKTVAESIAQSKPDLALTNMRKDLRRGKVLIDWSQNSAHKTTVCVYSLRAVERPTVSAPVTWDELEEALRGNDADRLRFELDAVIERVDRHGDLFAGVLDVEQRLPR